MGVVEKFIGQNNGDTVYGTYLCIDMEGQPNRFYFDLLSIYATSLAVNGTNPQILGIFRTSSVRFQKLMTEMPKGCYVKEKHYGKIKSYSFSEFMDSVPEFHTKMIFHKSLEEALATRKNDNLRN